MENFLRESVPALILVNVLLNLNRRLGEGPVEKYFRMLTLCLDN
jgi:hypothetical protein